MESTEGNMVSLQTFQTYESNNVIMKPTMKPIMLIWNKQYPTPKKGNHFYVLFTYVISMIVFVFVAKMQHYKDF